MNVLPTELCPHRVIHADSLDVLKSMADGCVDHTITDPPYSDQTHTGARTSLKKKLITTFEGISAPLFVEIASELVRVTKRWVLMTCDWHHAAIAEAAGLPVVRLGIWVKPDAAPQFTGDRPATGWEAVLIMHRPGRKQWNGGGHHAVWHCGVQRDARHPTEKPLSLVRRWVRLFSDPGETIFDPFAGSGTTGVAAKREGRRALLIEKNEKYADICRERVGQARDGFDPKTGRVNGGEGLLF